MPRYLLTELADDGTLSITELAETVTVTQTVTVTLTDLLPKPEPAPLVAAPEAA